MVRGKTKCELVKISKCFEDIYRFTGPRAEEWAEVHLSKLRREALLSEGSIRRPTRICIRQYRS